MSENQDRAITVTFSMQISSFNKLLDLCAATNKKRSELLALWVDRETSSIDRPKIKGALVAARGVLADLPPGTEVEVT
jgi:hypothetical protein